MGPRPDLRRMLVPLGPVAVFGASNFPLAFSVPRRRHSLRASRGVPGGAQGAQCAPGDLTGHTHSGPGRSPTTAPPRTTTEIDDVWRRDRLGGPIREYQQIA
jgi:hypothetical protein